MMLKTSLKTAPLLVCLSLLGRAVPQRDATPDAPSAQLLLKEAEALASAQQKSVLLIFSASWCRPCHLLQEFLAEPAVSPIFNRHFVKLMIVHGERLDDPRHHDTPGGDQLLDSLHDTDTSLPLIVMLNSSGQLIVDFHPSGVRPSQYSRQCWLSRKSDWHRVVYRNATAIGSFSLPKRDSNNTEPAIATRLFAALGKAFRK